jgi:hypothetical protein
MTLLVAAYTFRGIKREMGITVLPAGALGQFGAPSVGNEPLRWIPPEDPPPVGEQRWAGELRR